MKISSAALTVVTSRSLGAVTKVCAVLLLFVAVLVVQVPMVSQAAGECPSGWTFDSVNNICSNTISATGAETTVAIPSGIASLTVTIRGGAGGLGGRNSTYYGDSNRGQSGQVGQVTGTLSVTSATVLKISVGANGSTGKTGCGSLGYCTGGESGQGGPGGTSPVSGYNGGAGSAQGPQDWSGGGGGGGAASILKVDNVIHAIAGGAGGGGGGAGYNGGGTGTANNSYVGTTSGANGVQPGGDAGGAGGGGGGYRGGTAGTGGGGDYAGSGGNAGQNLVPATWTGSYVAASAGSVVLSYGLVPNNTVAPSVPTSPTVPTTYTGSAGTWLAATTYTYQWLLCGQPAAALTGISGALVVPNDCTAITNANSLSMTPTNDMLGSYLRLAVTATNSTGTMTSMSATSADAVTTASTMTPDLTAASDSGSSNSDDVTSDTTPDIDLAGLVVGANVTVTATKGSETSACSFVASATTRQCNFGPLSDGVWTVFSVQAIGAYVSAPSTMSVTVDTTAPSAPALPDLVTASDTGSSSSDDITSDNTPRILVPGVTNGLTVTVTASRPGSPNASCTYVASVSATGCDLPTLADGSWSVVAATSEVDAAGNSALPSAPLPLVVGTSIDAGITADLMTASDTGSSSSDNITKLSTVSVGISGGNTGFSVVMTATRNGYSNVTCSYVVSPTTTSCSLAGLAEGTWDIAASVTNPTINVTGTTPVMPVTIDLTSPSSSSTPDLNISSDTGYSTTDNITKDATPRIDVGSVAMGMTVTVIASRTGSPDVSCSFIATPSVTGCDLPALSDGTWSVFSRVSDVAGNVSSNSSALSVVVDTTTAVSNVSVLGGGSLAKGVLPDLLAESDSGASSTDNVTQLQALAVSVPNAQLNDVVTMVASRSGSADISCSYRVSATASSCILQTLSFGNWKINGTVTDVAGNSYETDPLPVAVSNIVGLPAVDKAEISTKLSTRGGTTEVKISIPSSAGQVATRKFEVAVLNSAGAVIRTQSISLPAGTRTASFTMPSAAGATRVMVYATNEFGVSNRARVGANVRHRRSNLICQGTGQSMYSESSLTERVVFSAASPLLDAQDKATLNKVAKFMANRGGQIVITGLARKNGIDSLKFLTNLSIERARNVAMYLSSRGVRAWINYEGFGAVSKEIGTPLDRRVDVCWTSQPLETK